MPTINDLEKLLIEIHDYVVTLPQRLLINAGQIVIYSGLSEISETLGIIRAGEFRAGNSQDTGLGFSGMRMVFPPAEYNSEQWNLVGLENDTLQFGVRASDGKLIAGGGNVILDVNGVTANAGNIAGWQIQPTRLTNSNISLYSSGSLQTNDFASGVLGRGWKISSDGSAELNNAFVRGELRTTILTYQEIQAVSGTLAIFKSAGSLRSEATISSGTFTIDITDPISGHVALFAVNDRLRIKTGLYDSWFNVTAVSDQTTFYRYTCSYVSGNQTIYPAGTAVINYGQDGQGLIEISTIGTSAPFLKLGKHSGSPHINITEYLRIGNLNGNYGYTSTKYGIGIGEYVTNKPNIVLDEDGILRFRLYTTEIMRFESGNALITGKLLMSGINSAIAIGSTPPTSSNTGTGLWIDRTGLYGLNSDVREAYFGSDGKFYAGGGNVKLDKDGISLGSTDYYYQYNSIKFMAATDLINEIYSIGSLSLRELYIGNSDYNSSTSDMYLRTRSQNSSLISLQANTTSKSSLLEVIADSASEYSTGIFMNTGGSYRLELTRIYFSIFHGASTLKLTLRNEFGFEAFRFYVPIVSTKGISITTDTNASSPPDNSLQLQNRNSHPTSASDHIIHYNYNDIPVYRNHSNYILSPNANNLLMPLQFPALSALWFTTEGYTNLTHFGVTDVSPNHIPMTRLGSGWYWSNKNSRPAGVYTMLHADGSTCYWSRTCNGGLNRNNWITFGAWVYIDSVTRNHGIARAGTSTIGWWLLYQKPAGTGYFELYVNDGGSSIYVQQTNENIGWHFVGMRYAWISSTNWFAQLFLDGVYITRDHSNIGTRNQMVAPVGDFELGRAGTGNYYLQGYLPTAWFASAGSGEELVEYYHATKGMFVGTSI